MSHKQKYGHFPKNAITHHVHILHALCLTQVHSAWLHEELGQPYIQLQDEVKWTSATIALTTQPTLIYQNCVSLSCVELACSTSGCSDIHVYMYMINTQTLTKDKTKTYKSNPKAATFQRNIAASGVEPRTFLYTCTSTHKLTQYYVSSCNMYIHVDLNTNLRS